MHRTALAFALPLAAVLLIINPFVALAKAPQYQFDKPHCTISFKVRHTLAFLHGKFNRFEGDIRFSTQDLAHSSMRISIKSASLDTGINELNQRLINPEFFDAAQYPEIKFVSQRITHQGGDEYALHGKLAIKGIEKDFTIPFRFLGEKPDPMHPDRLVAGFEAAFNLDRLAYHVGNGEYYRMGVAGKEVQICLDFELVRKP